MRVRFTAWTIPALEPATTRVYVPEGVVKTVVPGVVEAGISRAVEHPVRPNSRIRAGQNLLWRRVSNPTGTTSASQMKLRVHGNSGG